MSWALWLGVVTLWFWCCRTKASTEMMCNATILARDMKNSQVSGASRMIDCTPLSFKIAHQHHRDKKAGRHITVILKSVSLVYAYFLHLISRITIFIIHLSLQQSNSLVTVTYYISLQNLAAVKGEYLQSIYLEYVFHSVSWTINDRYLEIRAICREVHLDHKTWDVFAIADSIQCGTQSQIIKIHCILTGTDC